MAFKINTTTVADTTGWVAPNFATASRPASPVQGQVIYNTDLKKMEIYDGGYWKQLTDSNRPYLYRTIITNSYVMGGYQSSSPWKNVNRMTHSSDVCTNLGDKLTYGASYVSGACSLTKGYLWGVTDTYPGSTNTVEAFNMSTETNAGTSFGTMRNARDDSGTVFKEHYFAYIAGGGTADVDVFNLTNETMYVNNTGPDASGTDDGSGMSDENAAYLYTTAGQVKFLFSTTVAYGVTDTNVKNAHGQQKGINSKIGKGWGGNEGSWNGGYNLRRWSFATDTNLGTVAKPIGNSGEENFDMGQDKQYMMGCYDGAQNNRGWKFTYSTESGSELGSGSVRTGVAGGSSGHCVWRA
jgi:hypothetical protein